MKKYRCIPISMGIPIAFMSMSAVQVVLTWYYWVNMHDINDVYMGIVICSFGCIFAIITAFPALRRIEICQNKVICKGLLPRDTFELEYANCNVGIDYHCQYGRKIWWIYLCYGPHPRFKKSNQSNRTNALKIKPGFIKIMYSDEVYNALIEVLPKKQRTALETARRYANFNKQGKIVF